MSPEEKSEGAPGEVWYSGVMTIVYRVLGIEGIVE